jgi:Tat protein translocase TatC
MGGFDPSGDGVARRPPSDGARMSLVEHLRELRGRLGKSLLAFAVCSIGVFIAWEPVYDFLRQPYCSTTPGARDCDLFALGIFDQLKVRLRVAFLGGAVLSAPVWLYQLGAFITPALHRKEKRYAFGFLAASLLFFGLGTVFAYLTISRGLDFLLRIGGGDITTLVSVQSYLSFVTLCLIAFGIAFEFPVIVTFLNMVGAFRRPRCAPGGAAWWWDLRRLRAHHAVAGPVHLHGDGGAAVRALRGLHPARPHPRARHAQAAGQRPGRLARRRHRLLRRGPSLPAVGPAPT